MVDTEDTVDVTVVVERVDTVMMSVTGVFVVVNRRYNEDAVGIDMGIVMV